MTDQERRAVRNERDRIRHKRKRAEMEEFIRNERYVKIDITAPEIYMDVLAQSTAAFYNMTHYNLASRMEQYFNDKNV